MGKIQQRAQSVPGQRYPRTPINEQGVVNLAWSAPAGYPDVGQFRFRPDTSLTHADASPQTRSRSLSGFACLRLGKRASH